MKITSVSDVPDFAPVDFDHVMAGDKRDNRRVIAMSQRDARIRGNSQRRRHARDNLERRRPHPPELLPLRRRVQK